MFENSKTNIEENIVPGKKEGTSATGLKQTLLTILDDAREGIADAEFGVLGSITPVMDLNILNKLPDGVYEAQIAGVYKNGLTSKEGYYTRFRKTANVWQLESETKVPAYDDTQLKEIVTNTENKVDDFIRDFAVEVDQAFDRFSKEAQSGVGINDYFFAKEKSSEDGITDLLTPLKIELGKTINDSSLTLMDAAGYDVHYFSFTKDIYIDILTGALSRAQKVYFTNSTYSSYTASGVLFTQDTQVKNFKIAKSLSSNVVIAINVLKTDTNFKAGTTLITGNEIQKDYFKSEFIPTISEVNDKANKVDALNSNALNEFIENHFRDDVVDDSGIEIRTFPNATKYTDYPMGIINDSGLIASETNTERRWSGNINVSNYNSIKFNNLIVSKAGGKQELAISILDENNKVIFFNQYHDVAKELILPKGAKNLRHNVYAGPNILSVNYSDYQIFGYKTLKKYERNESLQKFINSGGKTNSNNSIGNNSTFKLESLGVKLRASDTTRSTVYRPCVIRADLYLKNPMAKYYIYHSTDHGGGNAIMMSYTDDIEGDWTYFGDVCKLSEQGGITGDIETPWVIWEPTTQRFLMYWHTGQAYDELSQNTFISESIDGVTWKFVGKAFKFPARFVNGNGHNGYFHVIEQNGLFVGTHAITGSNMSRFTRSISKDGINWITELDGMAVSTYGTAKIGNEYYNFTHYIEENKVVSPKLMACKISNDFKSNIGTYFQIGESLLGNVTSVTNFIDTDGTVYVLVSDSGYLDPVNNSSPINAKTISLFKVVTNHKK